MSFLTRSAPSPQEEAREAYIKKNITETLGLALKTLQQKHVNSEEPIYSEDSANTVCGILEAVFLHGLKASFSHKLSSYLIGIDHSKNRQPSYWELLTRFSHKDVVSQLNHLGQITTEIGMCRAWLRVALNDGLLESYLDAMLADRGTLRYFYKRTAYLRDEEQAGILKSYTQGILNFRFQLSYNSSVLNIWTTTPLVLAGLVEQTVTPRAALPSSVSDGAISQLSAASSVDESTDLTADKHRVGRSHAAEPHIASSQSYSGDFSGAAAASAPTPINSGLDPAALSRTEIEEIRKLTEQARGPGTSSTPTSQISFPDYAVEGRFKSSPDASSSNLRSSPRSAGAGWDRTQNQRLEASIEEESSEQEVPVPSTEDFGDSKTEVKQETGNEGQMKAEGAMAKSVKTSKSSKDSDKNKKVKPKNRPAQLGEAASVRDASSPRGTGTETDVNSSGQSARQTTTETGATGVSAIIKPPPHLQRRKSEALQPVLSDVTPNVEVAREMSPTTILGSNSGSDPGDSQSGDMENQPYGIYDEYAPSPQGNKLGSMQGWSSEFQEPEVPFGQVQEETPAEVSLQREISLTASTQESYSTLLQDYPAGPVNTPSMSQVLENLSPEPPGSNTSATLQQQRQEQPMSEDYDYPEDYDVLPIGYNVRSEHADPENQRTQQLVSIIGQICNEKGLDQQNYQCNGCSRPIGMIYGKARDCSYDGSYYCYECHENDESIIPSRIVHNWDFSKYKVARHTMQFLKQVEDDPLLNIQHINPRLYDHAPEMSEIREVRTQLRFLKAYLFTCKQSVADDLRKQLWPREYLYDDIHLYSVQDLLQVPNGQLVASLRKVIKYASKHVYDCRLCSQKGFICEVCNSAKVIYPFEADTTWRCDRCNAVYHKECKPSTSQCPKCERRRHRQMSLGSDLGVPDPVDYAYVPE